MTSPASSAWHTAIPSASTSIDGPTCRGQFSILVLAVQACGSAPRSSAGTHARSLAVERVQNAVLLAEVVVGPESAVPHEIFFLSEGSIYLPALSASSASSSSGPSGAHYCQVSVTADARA